MRIPKRVFFLVVALPIFLLVIFISLFAISYFSIYSSGKVECTSFTYLYFHKTCGLIKNSFGESINKIDGVVTQKYTSDGFYRFNFKTLDSNGRPIMLPITISEDPIPKFVTLVNAKDQRPEDKKISITETLSSAESLHTMLNEGTEVNVNIYIPTSTEINEAKKKFGNMKEFQCVKNQQALIDFLKDSTLSNFIALQLSKLTSRCDFYTLQIDKIKQQ